MTFRAPPPIPLSVPSLGGNESRYVQQCLETNWVSSAGPFVDRFEREFAARLGRAHAVATVNGTAALHVALLVAGVGPGDLVPTSDLTFIATANAIRYTGATPLLVDSDLETWQMDPTLLVEFLDRECERRPAGVVHRDSGRRVAALLPVHLLGQPARMAPLLERARDLGLPVIEDASESLGASCQGRPVGGLGDIACFSFNGNKLITCGGGGMIVTDREDWAGRARHLTTQAKLDPFENIHDEIGYNYRLTNVAAAIGTAQLERLDQLLSSKRRIAARYRAFCDASPGLTFMPSPAWAEPACWLSSILVDEETFGIDSRALARALKARAIESRALFQPMHLSPAHFGCRILGGTVAESLWRRGLSLPSSSDLAPDQQERVLEAIAGARA